jgi:hypothetical protein
MDVLPDPSGPTMTTKAPRVLVVGFFEDAVVLAYSPPRVGSSLLRLLDIGFSLTSSDAPKPPQRYRVPRLAHRPRRVTLCPSKADSRAKSPATL